MSRRVKPVKMFCFYISTFLVSANKAVYKFYIDDDDDDETHRPMKNDPSSSALSGGGLIASAS